MFVVRISYLEYGGRKSGRSQLKWTAVVFTLAKVMFRTPGTAKENNEHWYECALKFIRHRWAIIMRRMQSNLFAKACLHPVIDIWSALGYLLTSSTTAMATSSCNVRMSCNIKWARLHSAQKINASSLWYYSAIDLYDINRQCKATLFVYIYNSLNNASEISGLVVQSKPLESILIFKFVQLFSTEFEVVIRDGLVGCLTVCDVTCAISNVCLGVLGKQKEWKMWMIGLVPVEGSVRLRCILISVLR